MRIAVLEDDAALVELYKMWFSLVRHECVFYGTVAAYLAALRSERFDLLLIDMTLPDGSGEDVLKWVRSKLGWDLPIIFVTAHDTEAEVVNTLRLGADDYVIKPPKYFELVARVEALARRSKITQQSVLRFGIFEVDQDNRQILASGKVVELTQKEYEVACYLFQTPGRLLSRVHLLEVIWGLHAQVDTRTVDTHVSRLRRKLHLYPENGWEVISVYGYGYRLEKMDVGSDGEPGGASVPGSQS